MKRSLRVGAAAVTSIAVVAFLMAVWHFGEREERIDPSRFPKTPTVIPWPKAEDVLKSGRAWSVMQSHSLRVWIYTKDYEYFTTTEPRIDAAHALIEEYDPGLMKRYGTE